MRSIVHTILLTAATLCLLSCAHRDRSVSPEMLASLSSNAYEGDDFLSRNLLDVVRDSSIILDTSMTYRVRTCGMTDQMNSGRCWLFSTLNILRAEAIAENDLGEFYFSQTYGQFYDILEKSNRFLENVIDHRRRPMSARINEWLFKKPIGDGGQFSNAAHLIDKYGVVPVEAMPEQYSSTDNRRLMRTVLTILRNYGMKLRSAGRSELQAVKEEALSDIYRLLTATLGNPPASFEWRGETYTPFSFRDRFVRHDMEEDYAIFMSDPARIYYRMYDVENNRNCYEYADWTFLNVPVDVISDIAVESLRNGRMFYISADTEHDNLDGEGIYDCRIFSRLDPLLSISTSMDRAMQAASCESRSVHAIAVAGVRLDENGRPLAWLVENSYGTSRGAGGYITLSNAWFEKYLYRAVFEKRFVPDDILSMFHGRIHHIPSWNPNY